FYDDFCICVDMFEAQFEKTGATKGAELVRVDLSPEDEDEAHLEAFAETLAAHFN
ncbi:flavodoxin, partial [Citrobacter sp. TBCS-11]